MTTENNNMIINDVNDKIIINAKLYANEIMKNYDPSHDCHHIERVLYNANNIIANENKINNGKLVYDLNVIQLASIFHDIADAKYNNGNIEELTRYRIKKFFDQQYPDFCKEKIEKIIYCVLNVSWRSEDKKCFNVDLPIELKVVRDADRLEALGAIGILRCAAYSGAKNIPLYIKPSEITSTTKLETAIIHFFDKLLKIKERMQTDTGKKYAEERHDFIRMFLEQFWKEMDGKC